MGDHDLGVAGADGRRRPAGLARGGRGGMRALGAPLHADRRASRTPGDLRAFHDGELLGEIRAELPDRRVPAVQGRATPRAAAPSRCPRRPAARASAPRATRLAEHPLARVDLRALRPARRLAHRAPPRPRRGRAAAAPVAARAGRLARRARPGRRTRAAHRRGARRARGGAKRRLLRRRAARRSPTASTSATRRRARSRWELVEAIEGMARAAEALGIPVVSGNVSLYNETDGRAITPAPVVGCVGLVPDVRNVPRPVARGRRDRPRRRAGALVRRVRVPALWGQTGGHAATTSPPRSR